MTNEQTPHRDISLQTDGMYSHWNRTALQTFLDDLWSRIITGEAAEIPCEIQEIETGHYMKVSLERQKFYFCQ
jgi:hypothetical protein